MEVSGLRSQFSGLRSRILGLGSQVSGLRSQVSGLKVFIGGPALAGLNCTLYVYMYTKTGVTSEG